MSEFICWLLFIAVQVGIMRGLMGLEWLVTIGVTIAITLFCLAIRAGKSPGCGCWIGDLFD